MVVGYGWYVGVIGIVVGCLKEKFGCFVIVIVIDENGVGKGLGCLIFGVDLGVVVIVVKD